MTSINVAEQNFFCSRDSLKSAIYSVNSLQWNVVRGTQIDGLGLSVLNGVSVSFCAKSIFQVVLIVLEGDLLVYMNKLAPEVFLVWVPL